MICKRLPIFTKTLKVQIINNTPYFLAVCIANKNIFHNKSSHRIYLKLSVTVYHIAVGNSIFGKTDHLCDLISPEKCAVIITVCCFMREIDLIFYDPVYACNIITVRIEAFGRSEFLCA